MYSVLHFCSHLSNSVGGVPSTLEVFRHDLLSSYKSNHIIHIKRSDLHVRWEAGWHERLDVHVLPAQSESGGQLSSTDFKISKILPYKIKCREDPLCCQLLQAGAVDIGVVPGHVVPPWWLEVETLLHGLTPYLDHLLR